jgi:hypothetical protein
VRKLTFSETQVFGVLWGHGDAVPVAYCFRSTGQQGYVLQVAE